jgi:Cu(I)/Ag(I) efflux system membrane fusion protein
MNKILCFLGILGLTVLAFLAGVSWQSVESSRPSSSGNEGLAQKWYCSMHPQIIKSQKELCPICAMDLVPLPSVGLEGKRELRMSPAAVKLAEIVTAPVERRSVSKGISLVGKVDYDETRLASITAWISGRIDRLYVDYTGIPVQKGDHLVFLYSPELLTAQEELIRSLQHLQSMNATESSHLARETVEASREKLRLWGLTPVQIQEIEKQKKPSDHLTIYSPIGGIVVQKHSVQGMYVETGTLIYSIADLSEVWVKLDAYESDIAWIRYGQNVEFTTEAYPGEPFLGRVSFIDPMVKEETRTIKVRVNVANPEEKLKPGMFVRAVIQVPLGKAGDVKALEFLGQWVCPMHPEQIHSQALDCLRCGMPLVEAEKQYKVTQNFKEDPLVIPASAPLITGKRAVVFVQVPHQKEPTFECRQIVLGTRAGEFYLVRAGLQEGEQVVVEGNFKIDSSLQIMTKPSMMQDSDPLPIVLLEIPFSFKKELASFYSFYFRLQKALAQEKVQEAFEVFQGLQERLLGIDSRELQGEALKEWKECVLRFQNLAKKEGIQAEFKCLGELFEVLSHEYLYLIQRFGHQEKTYYQVFCPMAFENKGAFWLQDQENILNPYFGSAMLECGEIQKQYPKTP